MSTARDPRAFHLFRLNAENQPNKTGVIHAMEG